MNFWLIKVYYASPGELSVQIGNLIGEGLYTVRPKGVHNSNNQISIAPYASYRGAGSVNCVLYT